MTQFAISDATRGACLAFPPISTIDGRPQIVGIARFKFALNERTGEMERVDDGAGSIDLVDTYNGDDPACASIRRPSALFAMKPGTDVVLLGHAHPRKPGQTEVDVSLSMGSVRKTIRAFGLRVWKLAGITGVGPGPALPIREPIPLVYEYAFGGQDLSDPEKPLGEPRNYAGRGVVRNPKSLVDLPAHQLEYPNGSRVPAAFNPIHRHWQPRAGFAGTYDEKWMDQRMPLLPVDFDDRYHVCVPEDQFSSIPLRGDEPVDVSNASDRGPWRFQLPRLAPGFSSVVAGKRSEHRTHLDTVLLDADARTVELTWRAVVPMPKKLEQLDRILVFLKRVT